LGRLGYIKLGYVLSLWLCLSEKKKKIFGEGGRQLGSLSGSAQVKALTPHGHEAAEILDGFGRIQAKIWDVFSGLTGPVRGCGCSGYCFTA